MAANRCRYKRRAAVNKYDNGGRGERKRGVCGVRYGIPVYKSDHQKRRPVTVRTSRMSCDVRIRARAHAHTHAHTQSQGHAGARHAPVDSVECGTRATIFSISLFLSPPTQYNCSRGARSNLLIRIHELDSERCSSKPALDDRNTLESNGDSDTSEMKVS